MGWEQSSGPALAASSTQTSSRLPDVATGRPAKQQQARRNKPLPEGHFDPDELCRRLYLVLADQKAHAERRTRAETTVPNTASAPRPGATAVSNDINSNNTHISNSNTHTSNNNTYNHNPTATSTSRRDGIRQRFQDGWRPESYPASSRQPQRQTSTDLITELRRSRSSAKHMPSRQGLTIADPNATAISEHQYQDSRQSGEYHHVPKEAAKQFARTTTVDVMRAESENFIHHLSKRALRFHKQRRSVSENLKNSSAVDSVVPSDYSRALRQSQSQREKLLDRNQFQRTRILEEAAHLDYERQREQAQRGNGTRPHTFERELARFSDGRRNSTGNAEVPFDRAPGGGADELHNRRSTVMMMDPISDVDEDGTTPEDQQLGRGPGYPPVTIAVHEHRVDWSQSDELGRRPKLLLSPLLRKADSLWGLRSKSSRLGRKDSGSLSQSEGGGGRGGSQERTSDGSGGSGSGSHQSITPPPIGASPRAAPTSTLKSPKSSLFAIFKR